MPAYSITQREVDTLKRQWWENLSQKERDRYMKAISKFIPKQKCKRQRNESKSK